MSLVRTYLKKLRANESVTPEPKTWEEWASFVDSIFEANPSMKDIHMNAAAFNAYKEQLVAGFVMITSWSNGDDMNMQRTENGVFPGEIHGDNQFAYGWDKVSRSLQPSHLPPFLSHGLRLSCTQDDGPCKAISMAFDFLQAVTLDENGRTTTGRTSCRTSRR